MIQCHHKGEWYILTSGFNKSLHSTSGTIKLCSNGALQLVDIFSRMNATKFSTTKTGKEMVDYILMSPDLVQSVLKKVYQSFNQMVFIDHREMYLDLDLLTHFGSDTANLMQHNAHCIKTKDPQRVTKYIMAAHQHLSDNNS
eukprot:10969181-Ditylum_brightwellii.AAC.1